MKLQFSEYGVTIKQDTPKERYYTESALFHAIKKAMISEGLDVIKKNPQRDGHMLSAPYYIRDRKWKFAYTDGRSQIRNAAKAFREDGEIYLQKTDWRDLPTKDRLE